MKIAMVSEHASPLAALGGVDAGGQNVHVAALARRLGGAGHEVEVYTRRDDGRPARARAARAGRDGGARPRRAARPVPPRTSSTRSCPSSDAGWRGTGPSQGRPTSSTPTSGCPGWPRCEAAAGGRRPRSCRPSMRSARSSGATRARPTPARRSGSTCERQLAAQVDLVIATCSDEVAELARMGAPAHRARVVPCGVDTALFRPANGGAPRREHEAQRGPAARGGATGDRKGCDTVISALASLPGVELVIAGGRRARRSGRPGGTPPAGRRPRGGCRRPGPAARGHRPRGMPALYRCGGRRPLDSVVRALRDHAAGGGRVRRAAWSAARSAACWTPSRTGDRSARPAPGPRCAGRRGPRVLADPAARARDGARRRRRAVERYDWASVAAATEEMPGATVAAGRPVRPSGPPPCRTTSELTRGDRSAATRCLGHPRPDWPARARELDEDGLADGDARAAPDLVESWGRQLATVLPGGGRAARRRQRRQRCRGAAPHRRAGRPVPEDRAAFSAIALCAESSSLTAILNDYGAEEVFARQVEAHGRPGDILVALSTSGRAPTCWPRPSGPTTTGSPCGR